MRYIKVQVREFWLMPPRRLLRDTRTSDAGCSPLLSARAGTMWSTSNHLLGWKALEEVGGLPAEAVPPVLAMPPVQKLGARRARCDFAAPREGAV